MALAPGIRIGPYEVVAKLGEGGMGEVYRARDTRLDRDVALKILPEAFASDPDRLARFEREAKVLASISHPNIATIHGVEQNALVMELVEGDDLSTIIAKAGTPEVEGASSRPRAGVTASRRGGGAPRGLDIDDAVAIAKQIADALEAAHDSGIIHRDLKPGNVKVRADGMVKVLDFGLAKALTPDSGPGTQDPQNSPTLTARATQLGVILGTAAYMSPEQAKGKAVDRRADIWAFGVVLHEMLTGNRPFKGEDVSDTLAAVLRQDVQWSALPAATPRRLRRLLERCLDRDVRTRLRDIGEARVELSRLQAGVPDVSDIAPPAASLPTTAAPTPGGSLRPWLLGALGGAALASIAAWIVLRPPPPPHAQPMHFSFVPSATSLLSYTGTPDRVVAIAPDGSHIAFATADGSLVVRAIRSLVAKPVPGAASVRTPFFSHDSQWIGYFNGGSEIRKVPISGGPTLPICTITSPPRGASWGGDDSIVFATADPTTGLWTVPAAGGTPTMISKPDNSKGEGDHLHPFILPDGNILFTITPVSGQIDASQVAVLDRKTGATTVLLRGGSHPAFVAAGASGDGYLIYGTLGSLHAARFNLTDLKVEGTPVPVVEQVGMASTGASEFDVARDGTLIYLPGSVDTTGSPRRLVWKDRKGVEEPIKTETRAYYSVRLSPDGTRLALDVRDGLKADIWTYHLARGTLTPLTFDPALDILPVWTTDSRRVVFSSTRDNGISNLFWQAADGSGNAERLTTSGRPQSPSSFSPDGSRLLITSRVANDDIGILQMDTRQVTMVLSSPTTERNPDVSPDGKWLAYESFETNPPQIYVRPFPDVNGGRWQISRDAGVRPAWSPKGDELFFTGGGATGAAQSLYAVSIPGHPKDAGNPVKLFDVQPPPGMTNGRFYDVSRDGQRFIVIKPPAAAEGATAPQQLVVVVNWIEELKAKIK